MLLFLSICLLAFLHSYASLWLFVSGKLMKGNLPQHQHFNLLRINDAKSWRRKKHKEEGKH